MTPFRRLFWGVRERLRNGRSDRDLQEQIHAHIEEATEEYVRSGLSPADARRAARLDFGSVVQAEETYRDVRGRWLQDVSKDIAYALRSIRRDPGFAAVAVLSLAVGIGANTTIFTVVNSFLLRPRPIASPEQVVELFTGRRDQPYQTCSYPSYLELRDRNQVFTGLAAYSVGQFRLSGDNGAEKVWGETVSGNYFEVLGVKPGHGRPIVQADDDGGGGSRVAVIGDGLWRRWFKGDPNVVGRAITVNGQQLMVVGIAPPEFTGMMRGLSTEIWVPVTLMPSLDPVRGPAMLTRNSLWLTLVGRLKPGTTVKQSQVRFDLLSREMQRSHPEEWRSRSEAGVERALFVSVLRESESRVHPGLGSAVYAGTALLFVVVNLVLVVACANLASMLLARGVVRRKELAIRLAIGASRWRIVRQLVIESVLLALIAGAAGFVLTVWLLKLLLATIPALPEGIRLAVNLQLDWRVLAYTIAFSTLTGVVCGLVPALQSSRPDVSRVLKDDSIGVTAIYRKARSRQALVLLQVTLSVVLLTGAGLMVRSLEKLRPTRVGFTSNNVLVVHLELDKARYDRQRSQEFYRALGERVSSLPGVQAVSFADTVAAEVSGRSRRSTEIEGYRPGAGESMEIDANLVGPRYFTHMHVPIVEGRDIDEHDRDGAPCVAVVNEAFAARYFGAGISPLGKRLAKFEFETKAGLSKRMCEIVGVIRDDQLQSLNNNIRPLYATALAQSHANGAYVLVHTAASPAQQVGAIRKVMREMDPSMPINEVQTLLEYFSASTYPFRVLGIVMAACGLTALLLASVGIYGVVSYATAQRRREVGIRMALGAFRTDILRLMVSQGMAPVCGGLVLGLLLSAVATRTLTSSIFETELLFGVSANDPLTFTGVAVSLALVAAIACYLPARKAATVDPVQVLRSE